MGSACALLLTQPASPTEADYRSSYGTDLQELPQTVVGLNETLSGDALPSCVCAVFSVDFLLTGDMLPCDVLLQEPVCIKRGIREYMCASSFCVSRTGIFALQAEGDMTGKSCLPVYGTRGARVPEGERV